jgi:hypothetical protein
MSILVTDDPGTLFDATDRRREYLERPFNVSCKDCHRTDSGSQMELEAAGWSLTWRGEICGSCEAINKQFAEVFA